MDLILKKIEEMNASIAKMQEELKVVSASLKSLAVSHITQSPTVHVTSSAPKPVIAPVAKPTVTVSAPKPAATPAAAPATPIALAAEGSRTRSLNDVKMSFPEDLEARLSFEEKGEFIVIKPKSFLGSDNFAKIALTIRGMGGEYISAGKDSHFRVPKKKA
jgi:vacuolar-type H+-ATPase subunit D/Vma8